MQDITAQVARLFPFYVLLEVIAPKWALGLDLVLVLGLELVLVLDLALGLLLHLPLYQD
jgi:hypothetical protein